MNFRAIRKTMVTRWDDEFECYVAESPLYERCHGAGETEKEAEAEFLSNLDIVEEQYQAGNLAHYPKPGRPAKDKVRFNTTLSPRARQELAIIAKHLGGISQGEAIEYLVMRFKEKKA